MRKAFQYITDGLFSKLASKYYHYTSFEACYNIIESNDIWMSDIHYLNDTTEILSCKRRALQRIGQRNIEEVSDLFDYYVFSLSCTSNSLSQWDRYADDNYGVCIEFDLEQDSLFQTLIQKGYIIPQCVVYRSEKVEKIIEHCYEIAEMIYKNINETNNEDDIQNLLKKIAEGGLISLLSGGILEYISSPYFRAYCNDFPFVVSKIFRNADPYMELMVGEVKSLEDIYLQLTQLLYPFVKAETFALEEEMRFVYAKRRAPSYAKVKHRMSDKGIIVPYVKMRDMVPNIKTTRNLPITKIIIGSSVSDDRKIRSLKDFLQHKNLSHIKVEKSELPYRSLKKR